MPDLAAPEPPTAQIALRARLEAVLEEYRTVVSYSHQDRFWESTDGRQAMYGWGTVVRPRSRGKQLDVWLDGLDNDIAVSVAARWGGDGFGMNGATSALVGAVLRSLEAVLREVLDDYR